MSSVLARFRHTAGAFPCSCTYSGDKFHNELVNALSMEMLCALFNLRFGWLAMLPMQPMRCLPTQMLMSAKLVQIPLLSDAVDDMAGRAGV